MSLTINCKSEIMMHQRNPIENKSSLQFGKILFCTYLQNR